MVFKATSTGNIPAIVLIILSFKIDYLYPFYYTQQTGEDVIDMPVPSSYNDVTQNASIRDHIGWAWYQRTFFIPKSWTNQKVYLRFGSVNYHAVVVYSIMMQIIYFECIWVT